MPPNKITKPEPLALPLIVLRKCLGMTQIELSQAIGVTVEVLRNLDYGRTRLSPEILKRAGFRTGALWQPQDCFWVADPILCRHLGVNHGTVFNRELFERFRQLPEGLTDSARKQDISSLVKTVEGFERWVPARHWIEFLQRFRANVDQTFLEMQEAIDEQAAADRQSATPTGHMLNGDHLEAEPLLQPADVQLPDPITSWDPEGANERPFDPEGETAWPAGNNGSHPEVPEVEARSAGERERVGEVQPESESESESEPVARASAHTDKTRHFV
jgi:transcriptional regulator with XRE-family HTH domain